ncbi:MAG: DegT/DnrJ/EryC1/StrS family aminotransferase [bacterium]
MSTLPPNVMDDPELQPDSEAALDALDTAPVLSSELMEAVAEPLRVTFRAASCHFAGRGAAALLALLQAIHDPGGEVILPTLVCPSVPIACKLAGLVPVYADARLSDYTMDPAHVATLVTSRTVAIIAVHLYGHPCQLDQLRDIADVHGLLLIEDCAQSLGQFWNSQFVGTIGDAAILSFHPSKILPAAGGGAVLLSPRAASLAGKIGNLIAAYPEDSAVEPDEQRELARRGNAILNTARLDPTVAIRYRALSGPLAQGIPSQVSGIQLQGIRREWDTLDRVIPQRELRARRYRALLTDPLLIHPSLEGETQPLFRYTLRPDLEGEAAVLCAWHLTEALRYYGFHASNLYYPVHALLGDTAEVPVADSIARSLVNLWLDPSATAQSILEVRRVFGHVSRRTNYLAPPVGD